MFYKTIKKQFVREQELGNQPTDMELTLEVKSG